MLLTHPAECPDVKGLLRRQRVNHQSVDVEICQRPVFGCLPAPPPSVLLYTPLPACPWSVTWGSRAPAVFDRQGVKQRWAVRPVLAVLQPTPLFELLKHTRAVLSRAIRVVVVIGLDCQLRRRWDRKGRWLTGTQSPPLLVLLNTPLSVPA